jgi:hypothetical protein
MVIVGGHMIGPSFDPIFCSGNQNAFFPPLKNANDDDVNEISGSKT